MESSAGFPESPMEADDIAYPCKGCGKVCNTPPLCLSADLAMPPPDSSSHTNDVDHQQIFEEGKAFELGMFYNSGGNHLSRPIY